VFIGDHINQPSVISYSQVMTFSVVGCAVTLGKVALSRPERQETDRDGRDDALVPTWAVPLCVRKVAYSAEDSGVHNTEETTEDAGTEDVFLGCAVEGGALLLGLAFFRLSARGLAVLLGSVCLAGEEGKDGSSGRRKDAGVATEVGLGIIGVARGRDEAYVYETNKTAGDTRTEDILLCDLPKVNALLLCLVCISLGLALSGVRLGQCRGGPLGRYCGLGGDGCGLLAEVGGDDVDFGSVVCNVVCGGWFSCEEGLIWLGLLGGGRCVVGSDRGVRHSEEVGARNRQSGRVVGTRYILWAE